MITIEKHEGVTCVELVTATGRGFPVYIYMVDNTIIDTGTVLLENELASFYNSRYFDSVVLTHSHEDHSGTAPWIEQNKQVPIFIHPLGIPVCEKRGDYPRYRRLAWGIREPFNPFPIGDTFETENATWDVIYTPGHADDHVCLYDKNTGRLLAGDMFIREDVKVMLDKEDIGLMMNSLKKLIALDFQYMYCGHTGFHTNGKQRLQNKLDHLQAMFDSVKNLYDKGYDVDEIHQTLFKKTYMLIEMSEGEYDTKHIVTSIIKDIEKERAGKN